MKTLTFDTFPTPLSRICLGTASLGADGLTGAPVDRAFAILDAYYALGGRFLDTANVYGKWGVDQTNASEIVIGRWRKTRQITDMTITTKACHYNLWDRDTSRVTASAMETDIEESRAALDMDKLQICLLHRDNEAVDIRTIVDFCVKQVQCGKVTRFGLSNYRTERVKMAIDYLGNNWKNYFVAVSNEWSLAMENAEGYTPVDGMVAVDLPLRQLAREKGFGIFSFSSIAHGFFAKLQQCGASYTPSCAGSQENPWSGIENFRGRRDWLTPANGEAYNSLRMTSEKTGVSVHSLSIAYLLRQENTIPILSVSHPEQLEGLKELTMLW